VDRKDIPEPIKSSLDKIWPDLSTEVRDIIEMSLDTCPDWASVEDSIHNCLQLLMDDAHHTQDIINGKE
jgi:hypothetical protein